MNHYPEGQIVEIIVPFKDLNGADIVPSAISAVLFNGEDDVLQTFGVIPFQPGDTSVTVSLLATMNQLEDDNLEEVRRLVVTLAHAAGTVRVSKAYVIEAEQSLQIMRNSFMTFETAEMLAARQLNLSAYAKASDVNKRAALFEAWRRIVRLPMTYRTIDEVGKVIATASISALQWEFFDADAFRTQLPSHFQRTLRYAQLTEADEVLRGDVVARKHALGIASETIGETSTTFRNGFVGAGAGNISPATYALLSSYIDASVRIARA